MSTSPPIARAVAVLNFLGGHPGQSFTLTEIAKSLRISSATCHTLLGALVEAGYVYRTAAKSYVLGPALSQLAQTTLSSDVLMQVVRPEMRLIADEFDAVCSVATLRGEDVIVLGRAAAVSHIAWNTPEIPQQKAVAPFGNLFVAWAGPERIAAWLDRPEPPLPPAERAKIERTLTFLRANGFTFGERSDPLDGSDKALALRNQRDKTRYGTSTLDPTATYNLAFVAAPVFASPVIAATRTVALTLNLLGFEHPVEGRELAIMGERLRTAADRISRFIAGRPLAG